MSEHFLFAVNRYPPHVGGVENHVSSLAEELVRQGHRCTVITIGDSRGEELRNGVRVIRLRGSLNIGSVLSFPEPGTTRILKKFIRDENVTVVSVHTRFFPLSWLGVSAARRRNVPSVLTEHGSNSIRGVSPIIMLASWCVDATLGRNTLKRATRVLAVSEASAAFVNRLSGRSAEVFYNAIDTRFWSQLPPTETHNIVYIGRLVPGKGWRESVLSFETIASHNSTVQLHLFGGGPSANELEHLVAQSAYSNRIHIRGAQRPEDIRSVLAGAIYVNPTSLSEGFQTTLLEAAAAGARIVSYPTPGLGTLEASGATIWRADSVETLGTSLEAAASKPNTPLTQSSLECWSWRFRAATYESLVTELRAADR